MPEQLLEVHRRRELGSAAEAPVLGVLLGGQRLHGGGEDAVVRCGGRRRESAGERGGDPAAGGLDLVALRPPRLRDGAQELGERGRPVPRGGREVRARVERAALGGEEDRHRPAALTRERLGGAHVDRVDVGPLLAVDLDVDEAVVHQPGDARVLERLVRHDVAPVAGGVPHGEQHRHVPITGLVEGLLTPLLPVDRVVGVLQEVGAGRPRQSVRHRPTLPRRDVMVTTSRSRAGPRALPADEPRGPAPTPAGARPSSVVRAPRTRVERCHDVRRSAGLGGRAAARAAPASAG